MVRSRLELCLAPGSGIAFERFTEPGASDRAVGTRTDLFHPTLRRGSQRRQAGIGRDRLGDLVVVRGQPHVGADPFLRARVAVDFVASVTAVLTDQVIALHQLGGWRLREAFRRLEIDHLMMALQAARLLKSLRQHRIDPVMVVEPTIFVVPLVPLLGGVGSMRRPFEAGGAPLPLMADGAAECLHWMGAGRPHKQIQPRMSCIRLGNTPTHDHSERLAPNRSLDQRSCGSRPGELLAPGDFLDHISAEHSSHRRRRLRPDKAHGRIFLAKQPAGGQVKSVLALQLLIAISDHLRSLR